LKAFWKVVFVFSRLEEMEIVGFWLTKLWELDLSGDEWNARMTAEGLLNCLKAEETAKGLLRTNDMIATMGG